MLAPCGSQGASISGALEGQERELIQLVSHYASEGLWEVCAERLENNESCSLPHRTAPSREQTPPLATDIQTVSLESQISRSAHMEGRSRKN